MQVSKNSRINIDVDCLEIVIIDLLRQIKKKLMVIFILLINSYFIYSQTEAIEIKNLSNCYQQGEFTIETYKQYDKNWHRLITDLDGYPKLS